MGTHRITRQDIIELLNERDGKVLSIVNRDAFGFKRFLKKRYYVMNNKRFDYEMFENLMEISGRACCASADRNFTSMLADCDEFLCVDALDVLNKCIDNKQRLLNNFPLFVKHYVTVLKTIVARGSASKGLVDCAFPSLQNIMNMLRKRNIKLLDEISQEYNKLKEHIDRLERPSPLNHDQDVEFSFRHLSIMPVENDVINVIISDLPHNKIDGPYRSIEHYLSVHFRLTREDMLRSFRDCAKIVTNPQDSFKLKCNLYDCVRITSSPIYTPDGICLKISIKALRVVDWQKKDTLLPGSIVCLTPNNFKTVVFATVKEIRFSQGKSNSATGEIRLLDLDDEKLQKEIDYVMIEPSAYFECYKHVLTAIKDFSEKNFPLADFLVFFNFENRVPEYLTQQAGSECSEPARNTDAKYCLHENVVDEDFHKLFLPECRQITNIEMSTEQLLEGPSGKIFNPLVREEWPTAEELKLDEMQHRAFITALTNKVAVIQGPPGTGKTFIGVKVVKALLLNAPRYPIVVCCMTNHALDQFLERIYAFNKNVVRLGSQSKSTILEANTMNNLMCAYREHKLYSGIKNTKFEGTVEKSLNHLKSFCPEVLNFSSEANSADPLHAFCRSFQILQFEFDLCKNNYIADSALNKIIDLEFKTQLRNKTSTESKTLSSSVMEWLSCSQSDALFKKCEQKFTDYKRRDELNLVDFDNVWHISQEDRYRLLYKWRKECLEILEEKIAVSKDEYKINMQKCSGKMPDSVMLDILSKTDVIGVTTTGAGKFRSLLQECLPKVLIIEEAAEVLESHTIASLLPTTEHLILIGDHMQLRPLPADHELSVVYNLNISMFERLFTNNCPSETLVAQHRMKPCIADLLVQDELYSDLTSYENVFKYEDINGVKCSMFFFNHSNPEKEMSSSTSASNLFEAQMIASFAHYLCQKNYASHQITIIAAYNAQIPLLEVCLKEENLDVLVTTVDNYQGEENDIVLVSFVRNNQSGNIGFLKENNRVCVALSRARKGMFCFGNFTQYSQKSRLWNSIIEKVEAKDMIGDKLPLVCSRHGKEFYAKSPEDVIEFSKRGCEEKCGFELACTHVCQRKCHSDDPDHLRYRCPLPCEKFIKENKKCPRTCSERCKRGKKEVFILDCGHPARLRNDGTLAPCYEEVQKCLPCMHVDTVPCNTDLPKHKCKALVSVLLPCGHRKNRECYKGMDVKSVKCDEDKFVEGYCGHKISVPCSLDCKTSDRSLLLYYCKSSCGKLLKCGHPCVGSCQRCLDFGIHAICRESCKSVLNCGHSCGGLCGCPCPPCEKRCSMSCFHEIGFCQKDDCTMPSDGVCVHALRKTECINQCARPCKLCEQQCGRKCKHGSCSNKCHEECSILPCSKNCEVMLLCGHGCLGLCGDPCPFPCLKCNGSELNFRMDRFVQLVDCEHIIEVNELNEHIEGCLECFTWPNCPTCSKPIQNSLRYKEQLRRARDSVLLAFDNSEEIDQANYIRHSMYGINFDVPAVFRVVDQKISKILEGDKPSSGTLFVLKHCLKSLNELLYVYENLEGQSDSVKYRFENLLTWISHHLESASYQQLDELKTSVDTLRSNMTLKKSV